MGDWRKEWVDAKKKFEALDFKDAKGKLIIDPKKAFGKMDFGPALDTAESAVETMEKQETAKTAEAADEAIKKALIILKAYDGEAKRLVADVGKTKSAVAKKADEIIGGAILHISNNITHAQHAIDKVHKAVARDNPEPVAKLMDGALRKTAAALGAAATHPTAETWNAEVAPAVLQLRKVLRMATPLDANLTKNFVHFGTMDGADQQGTDAAAVRTKVKGAAEAVKDAQGKYRKLLGLQ